ncbi:DUF1800 domain-containing protein [Aquincola sp. S2]|uniref:DUF1800 domain-containing protein n=1 Tax=Pseudaquabacterium terrae TaxID=2732868 RepID=A0ABX2EFM8_9BURK|nr:DUF1800 domain-containing protein [Aquabacterium terrae]NRF67406.1 DUF1800 domain-containing protein [Aquabacterium terrae]
MNIFRPLLRLLLLLLACSSAVAQTITVYGVGHIEINATRQLTANVPMTPNTVTWSVNGVVGGDMVYGTVSPSGLYRAPAAVPSANAVKVRATSTAYPTRYGEVTLTVSRMKPRLTSTMPANVAVGAFTLNLSGEYFTPDLIAKFDNLLVKTTFVSSTALQVSGTATSAQVGRSVPLLVAQVGHGARSSDTLLVPVTGTAPPPPPVTVAVAPTSVTLAPLATQTFTANVSGSSNTAVSWSVNGIAGGNATFGTVSAAGLYTAPAVVPSPAAVTVRATSAASASAFAQATVTVVAGSGGGTADLAAARLLEQAAFGPSPAALARVKQIGVDAWLNEQFAMPETAIPVPASDNRAAQSHYLNRLSAAPDQLRQRVAYALSQVIVVSINKNNYPDQIVPYLQILSRNAFGNYRTLLGEITVSPQMGKYLDLARSTKPSAGGAANENYARELLQLFTLGLVRLNPDGSAQMGGNGMPLPTYTQDEVQQLARALTGWVYVNNEWENFSGPMIPREVNHDTQAKNFLGCGLAAGQTTQQDTHAALDCIFAHPNVGPFIATRLIRSLVTSNPSPAYVQRITGVFNNNGSGVRGDLRATVRAILLDAEARNDAALPTSGRLKDPIFHILSIARALGGSISATNQQAWSFSRTGQTPLAPPSVFGFYSPMFRVPQSALYGPEFQIYSPTEAVLRGNFIWQILSNPGGDFPVDIQRFVNLGGNVNGLIDACDQTFLYGRMPAAMKQSISAAVTAQQGDNRTKALTALYLTLLSGQHAIQY